MTRILLKKPVLFISLGATVLFALLLARIDTQVAGSGGLGVVYLQLSFSKKIFESILASWGSEGIKLFISTLWLDFLYPLSYSFMISSALAHVFTRNLGQEQSFSTQQVLFIAAPFAAALFDYLENILHYIIITQRLFTETLILGASISATVKWVLIGISLLTLVGQVAQARFSKRQQ